MKKYTLLLILTLLPELLSSILSPSEIDDQKESLLNKFDENISPYSYEYPEGYEEIIKSMEGEPLYLFNYTYASSIKSDETVNSLPNKVAKSIYEPRFHTEYYCEDSFELCHDIVVGAKKYDEYIFYMVMMTDVKIEFQRALKNWNEKDVVRVSAMAKSRNAMIEILKKEMEKN